MNASDFVAIPIYLAIGALMMEIEPIPSRERTILSIAVGLTLWVAAVVHFA